MIGDGHRNALAWVAGPAAAAFGVLAVAVVARVSPLAAADVAVHDRMRTFSVDHPAWLAAMAVLTHLGDTATVWSAYVVIALVCFVRSRRIEAVFVVVTGALAGEGSRLLRATLGRPRPDDRLWQVDGGSFPSGHATNSAALAAIVVIVSWPLVARLGRIAVVVGAGAFAVTVGLTRVAGAVHWPTDVVGGWLFALACVAGSAWIALSTHGGRSMWALPRSGDD